EHDDRPPDGTLRQPRPVVQTGPVESAEFSLQEGHARSLRLDRGLPCRPTLAMRRIFNTSHGPRDVLKMRLTSAASVAWHEDIRGRPADRSASLTFHMPRVCGKSG